MSTPEADDHSSSIGDNSAEYDSDDDQQMQSRVCRQHKSGYDADIGERSPKAMPGKRLAPSTRPITGVLTPRGYRCPGKMEPKVESMRSREDSDPPQPTGLQIREGVRSQRSKDAAGARSGACAWFSDPGPQEEASETIRGHLEESDDDDSHFSSESDRGTADSPIEDGVASSRLDVFDDFEEEYDSEENDSSQS